MGGGGGVKSSINCTFNNKNASSPAMIRHRAVLQGGVGIVVKVCVARVPCIIVFNNMIYLQII